MKKPKTKKSKAEPKLEMKPKFRPINAKAVIIERGKFTEHPLDITESKELKINHDGRSLSLNRDDVLQKTFAETNWHGGVKQLYVFGDLVENGKLKLIGLEEFNPYRAISAKEADIMIHEDVTMRGVKSLVTKIKGKTPFSTRMWVFIVILVVIVAVVLKVQGAI